MKKPRPMYVGESIRHYVDYFENHLVRHRESLDQFGLLFRVGLDVQQQTCINLIDQLPLEKKLSFAEVKKVLEDAEMINRFSEADSTTDDLSDEVNDYVGDYGKNDCEPLLLLNDWKPEPLLNEYNQLAIVKNQLDNEQLQHKFDELCFGKVDTNDQLIYSYETQSSSNETNDLISANDDDDDDDDGQITQSFNESQNNDDDDSNQPQFGEKQTPESEQELIEPREMYEGENIESYIQYFAIVLEINHKSAHQNGAKFVSKLCRSAKARYLPLASLLSHEKRSSFREVANLITGKLRLREINMLTLFNANKMFRDKPLAERRVAIEKLVDLVYAELDQSGKQQLARDFFINSLPTAYRHMVHWWCNKSLDELVQQLNSWDSVHVWNILNDT